MGYDFGKLKTIHCFDAVTIRVPQRWQCGPDWESPQSWCCHEQGEETGTLWINVDLFLAEGRPPDRPFPR
jgi:hypothetical protein